MRRSRVVVELLAVLALTVVDRSSAQIPGTEFIPLRPCRAVDSRVPIGTFARLEPGQIRRVLFRTRCGIPNLTDDGGSEVNQATALALNIVAVDPSGPGHLVVWPANQAMPTASSINFSPGQNIANGVIVPMCDEEVPGAEACASGDISFVAGVSSVDLVVDVTGYYRKPVRPGTGRHGAGSGFDNFPCVNNTEGVRFGLSSHMAQAANSEPLCPAGTWVCTAAQVGGLSCDTSRPDGTCDGVSCSGTCINDAADNHRGWTATPFQAIGNIAGVSEQGVTTSTSPCELRPAWCCSRN